MAKFAPLAQWLYSKNLDEKSCCRRILCFQDAESLLVHLTDNVDEILVKLIELFMVAIISSLFQSLL